MISTEQKKKNDGIAAHSTDAKQTPIREGTTKNFLIVGIGASAGGLDAFKSLVKHLPKNSGMAFVLVQHLDPTHSSSLTKIISNETELPVVEAQHGMVVEPNCIYVMPSNADIHLFKTTLQLAPRSPDAPHLPIDSFFQSLAENHGGNAIGVVLSGTATDGTIGLKMIKSEGGVTFAQDESTAKYASMPRSAANAGGADFILPPEEIAAELTKIARQHRNIPATVSSTKEPEDEDLLPDVYRVLYEATRIDFRNYRAGTIKRRVRRRMMLNGKKNIQNYLEFLRRNKSEINALYADIFIHVTNFFRDAEKYEILRTRVFPKILANRPREEPVRMWIAGCSSGEEVYSLAIEFLEFSGSRREQTALQIFASDISESEIQKARDGIYSKNIEKDVSKKRLEKFFTKHDISYKIAKSVRDLCVFAKHDVTKDPPFSRMDLISCCNVLIYLESPMQKKILSTFYQSLKPSAFLLLGKSESTTGSSDLFEPIDKKFRIFVKRTAPSVKPPFRPSETQKKLNQLDGLALRPPFSFDWQREADRVALAKYKHTGFLIDENLKILSFRGDLTPFLAPAGGEASLELTKMVRKDLRLPLRAILQTAKKQMMPARNENIFLPDGKERELNLNIEVIPIRDPKSDAFAFLILFEEIGQLEKPKSGRAKGKNQTAQHRLISSLQRQLAQTKELSQVSVEELERLNEAMSSANEELQSANEELKSSNEEYENTKEQLESGNEELATLNEELQNRNVELDQTNTELTETRDYAEAIIKTMSQPLVVLDSQLRIRSANDTFYRVFEVSPRDADNAYFFDFDDRQWDVTSLRIRIKEILKTDSVLEDFEVERDFTKIGHRTILMNARRVLQKKGMEALVLLTMEDITHRKQLEEASSTMMKEIHHRIKNNLQVVTSLLSLQSRYVQDSKALAAFRESENRVRSMALIHEKLYESNHIGKIFFKEYVSDLVDHLFRLYGRDPKNVQLIIEVEDVYLDMDQAVPCGLIVNELLSNSLKYAFPPDRGGSISVGLKQQPGQATYILSIGDNGVGLPKKIDPENTDSMGLQIVKSLTRQLAGTLKVNRRNGTCFLFTFPKLPS